MLVTQVLELKSRVSPYATQKELDFLQSAYDQFLKKGTLSAGQLNWALIIDRKYSEEELEIMLNWEKDWSPWHRKTALNVAKYYAANPPYFQDYVARIMSDTEGFYLSKKEWDKFCENKYAKKIRKEYEAPLLFNVGQPVKIRATNKVRSINTDSLGRLSDKLGFVLKTNALAVTRAAKGSKIYQVLLAGDSKPIFCHESDLKRCRGTK